VPKNHFILSAFRDAKPAAAPNSVATTAWFRQNQSWEVLMEEVSQPEQTFHKFGSTVPNQKTEGRYGMRETQSLYIDHFGVKKSEISIKNTCFLCLN